MTSVRQVEVSSRYESGRPLPDMEALMDKRVRQLEGQFGPLVSIVVTEDKSIVEGVRGSIYKGNIRSVLKTRIVKATASFRKTTEGV